MPIFYYISVVIIEFRWNKVSERIRPDVAYELETEFEYYVGTYLTYMIHRSMHIALVYPYYIRSEYIYYMYIPTLLKNQY